jgi:GAF domain-containing protein
MKLPSSDWPADRVRAWTTALDAMASAGEAAASATAEADLMAATADALAGQFADWVIVDLAPESHEPQARGTRSVAGRYPQPRLASAVARLPLADCPLTVSAMEQRTPRVQASIADPAELGVLPDGQRVADVLGAGSYAVSPITVSGSPLGAITIVRDRSRPPVTFLELSVLAHIADLTAAAIERFEAGETPAGR